MAKNYKLAALLSIFVFAASTEVSMGMFDFLKVCLFSEVNGVVTQNGKPVEGAEVIRTAEINEKKYTDTTITDAQGRYYFKKNIINSLKAVMPVVESIVKQTIIFKYSGQEYLGWKMYKHNYRDGGEINKISEKNIKPLILKCDLNNKPEMKKIFVGATVDGICNWQ